MIRWLKRGVLFGAALAGVTGIVMAWLPKPVVVDAGRVERAPLDVVIEDDGRTRVHDRFVVAAPASGNLDRIALEPGARVERGVVIARIAPPDPAILDTRTRDEATARLDGAYARQRQAAAAIGRARASRDLAIREAERTRTLFARGAVTAAERERAELAETVAISDVATAEQQRDAAAAEVASVRALLARPARHGDGVVDVRAPASGTILRILRESAGPIAAGTPVVELGDPGAIEVVVDVLSSDATKIPLGAKATIDAWGGDHPLTGQVRLVEPAAFTRVSALGIEEQRVNVVIALDHTPAELGDGFRVTARIELWRGDVVTVPSSALFRDRERWAVYAIVDGRAALRPVEIGHRGALAVELISGLAEGDPIVLHPSDAVHDGVRVEPR